MSISAVADLKLVNDSGTICLVEEVTVYPPRYGEIVIADNVDATSILGTSVCVVGKDNLNWRFFALGAERVPNRQIIMAFVAITPSMVSVRCAQIGYAAALHSDVTQRDRSPVGFPEEFRKSERRIVLVFNDPTAMDLLDQKIEVDVNGQLQNFLPIECKLFEQHGNYMLDCLSDGGPFTINDLP